MFSAYFDEDCKVGISDNFDFVGKKKLKVLECYPESNSRLWCPGENSAFFINFLTRMDKYEMKTDIIQTFCSLSETAW